MSPLSPSGHVNREFVARYGPALHPCPHVAKGGAVLCASEIGAAPASRAARFVHYLTNTKEKPRQGCGVFLISDIGLRGLTLHSVVIRPLLCSYIDSNEATVTIASSSWARMTQPADGGVCNVIGSGDVGHRLASLLTRHDFAALLISQLSLAAWPRTRPLWRARNNRIGIVFWARLEIVGIEHQIEQRFFAVHRCSQSFFRMVCRPA
jgi:hypothetical protein